MKGSNISVCRCTLTCCKAIVLNSCSNGQSKIPTKIFPYIYPTDLKDRVLRLAYKSTFMIKLFLPVVAYILPGCISLYAQEARLMIPIEHEEAVVSTKWSPDGKFIITASVDKTAKIWDVQTGQILADLKGHQSELTDGIFSPDGKLVATTSNDATAKLWDAKSGRLLFTLNEHTSPVHEALFSSDSRWLATRSAWDQTIKVWDTQTGKLQAGIESANKVPIRAFFNPDGNLLYAVFDNEFFQVWDWKAKKMIREAKYPQHPVCDMADMSADGSLMLTVDSLRNVCIWNLPSADLAATFPFPDEQEFTAASFSPDGSMVLIAKSDFTLMTINASTGQKIKDFPRQHTGLITTAKFSPDGKTVLTTSWDKKSITWDAQSGDTLHTIEGSFEAAEFDPTGELVAFSSFEYHPEIWDSSGVFFIDLIGKITPITGIHFNKDGSMLMVKTSFDGNHIWNLNTGKLVEDIKVDGDETNTSELSPDGSLVATTTGAAFAEIWDARSGKSNTTLRDKNSIVTGTLFSPDSKRIITFSEDSSLKIWDTETGNPISEFTGSDFSRSIVGFNKAGDRFALTNSDFRISIYNASGSGTAVQLEGHKKSIHSLDFCPDGTQLLSTSQDGEAKLWNSATGELLGSFPVPNDVASNGLFSPDGKSFLAVSDRGKADMYNAETLQEEVSFLVPVGDDLFAGFSPDSKQLILLKQDSIISIHEASTGKPIKEINLGYKTYFDDINFAKGLIAASNNAEARLISIETGKLLASLFSFPKKEWAIVYPSGMFDASRGAMEMMYWVKDMEVIELSQMKEGYYQPGMWDMALQGKTQMPVADVNNLGMQPDVELGELKDGILPVTLTKRDGGYGKVVVFVNDKEVIPDARPANFDAAQQKQSFTIDVSKFIYPGIDNEITVKAESEDGSLKSRGLSKKVKRKVELSNSKPAFYAIICGTSQYADISLKLNFTVNDAKAIAEAMNIGASNLFGKDSVHIFLLTSPGATLTTKDNIRKVFEDVRKKAKPEDVVLVYLSGHGLAIGSEGKGDFYYLTRDAKSKLAEDYRNAKSREPVTVSTEELTQWMNVIPAQKNIMIIDACGSGKAVEKIFTGRSLETSQIKAIDRMVERTGLFIISGCASDEESFESNSLGQGLLTYSLLEGIKGAALKDNIFVDILNIFEHAREEVPKMAREGGNTQEPQMLVPQKGSFDIGIINESDRKKIHLATPKPVFVKAYLVESTMFDDTLNLSTLINDKLRTISENKTRKEEIIFIDADKYPGGCKITGGYSLENDLISFKGFLNCDQLKTPITVEKKKQDELVKIIIDQSLKASVKK